MTKSTSAVSEELAIFVILSNSEGRLTVRLNDEFGKKGQKIDASEIKTHLGNLHGLEVSLSGSYLQPIDEHRRCVLYFSRSAAAAVTPVHQSGLLEELATSAIKGPNPPPLLQAALLALPLAKPLKTHGAGSYELQAWTVRDAVGTLTEDPSFKLHVVISANGDIQLTDAANNPMLGGPCFYSCPPPTP